jgi:hypothetical protein
MRLSVIVAVLALAGCATVPQAPIAASPTCATDADCAIKWAAARTFVLDHSAYRVQTYSADYLNTFGPANNEPGLAMQINKAPIAGGAYVIDARFGCGNMFGCIPNARLTLDQFNRTVAAAGAQ